MESMTGQSSSRVDGVRRLPVLSTYVDEISRDKIDYLVRDLIAKDSVSVVAAVNPEKCITVEADPETRIFLESASLLLPDGIGVVAYSRLFGSKLIERVAGCDFALDLVKGLANNKDKVFLIGASDDVSQAAANYLNDLMSYQVVVSRINGYDQRLSDFSLMAELIESSGAKVVLVALGSPKQERWINQMRARLNRGVFMGVGGSFDVWAGAVPRAPAVFQSLGLEWLFRLLRQPARIFRQRKLIVFLGRLLVALVGRRKNA